MTARLSIPLAAFAALILSNCCVPPDTTCRSYCLGPAYNGEGHLYPRPSHVADHGYPTSFERVHHYRDPAYALGSYGYGTDCNAQIPYFYR